MAKIYIAYMIGSLNRGGKELLLLNMFRNLNNSDIQAILVFRKKGELYDQFIESGVKMYQLSLKNRFDLFYFFRLYQLLKKEKITIVHAQQVLDAFFAIITNINRLKIFITFHGFNVSQSKLSMFLYQFVFKYVYKCIFVTDFQKQYFIDKYKLDKTKCEFVYNGIDIKNTNEGLTEDFRKTFLIGKDTFLFGTVGNFLPGRDQLFICEFLNELNKKNQDFVFLFIGKRNEKYTKRFDDCVLYCKENGLEQKVSFLGSRNDVTAILSQLDAFIYASEHDTFGIAIIEAIAAKLPVFVNDWAVMNEITEDGRYANIYKTNEVDDLMIHFIDYMEHKEEYKKKAEINSELIKQKFSINKHIQSLTELYKSI